MIMKTILLCIPLFFALASFSQGKKPRLYAYSQATSAGVKPAEVDMAGNMKTANNRNQSYLIYLEVPRNKTLRVNELWINGQAHLAEIDTVATPIRSNSGIRSMEEKELVAATENVVIRLIPRETANVTDKNKRKYAGGKAVVVYFSLGKKNCKRSVEKIEVLPPRVME
jgi:hypothetical protein